MSTMRYSGELRIRVTYIDPMASCEGSHVNGSYRCYIVGLGVHSQGLRIFVGTPAVLTQGVDEPEAFDAAARAALAFAADDGWPVDSHAAVDAKGLYYIGRSAAKAWPSGTVIVETMPDQHRASHRAANNWGVYPHNGAVRSVESREVAEEIVANDPDGYAKIVTGK